MNGIKSATLLTIALSFAIGAAHPVSGIQHPSQLNPDSTTYDHHPSISESADGTTWIAWHTYKNGQDGISVRRLGRDGSRTTWTSISGPEKSHGPPVMVASSGQRAWVVWSVRAGLRWMIVVREWKEDRWMKPHQLSEINHDAVFPTALLLGGDRILVAWSERIGGRFQIRGCSLENKPSPVFDISDSNGDSYRPVLVSHNSKVWGMWDQYEKTNYSVHARQVLPSVGPVQQVSPLAKYCLTPTALSHPTGLHVAWLQKIDVIGGQGVVSQLHTLHAAIQRDSGWYIITDTDGQTEAAHLTQGLMAQISPRAVPTGGYLGSRVRPILAAHNEKVFLLWERKSNHRGSTPRVGGDLIARPIRGGEWQRPTVLHTGHVDYHVVRGSKQPREDWSIVASRLPARAQRLYERLQVKIEDAQPFHQELWPGWRPISLPIESEQTPRRQVTISGEHYNLYWADLHCHSNLSADAEGETDELIHYARDRAGLDVVVFTNNDFYNVPLTQYEYELGNLFASSQSIDGEFLSLPGYEWTSRIPGNSSARLDDPGNWMPPYRNRSFPNHRSVIYPSTGGPLIHFTEVGNDISRLNEAVAKAGGLTFSQHPNFRLSGAEVEVGLELTSGWSNYIAQNPKLFYSGLNSAAAGTGRKLGFVANGDSHRRAPGLSGALTGIFAKDLSSESILRALRSRSCFATSGSKIFLDARANGTFMGQDTTTPNGKVTLKLKAIGTRPIIAAALVRDGTTIHVASGDGRNEMNVEFSDMDVVSGSHWYYWRVTQDIKTPVLPGNLMAAHGHIAWSSPHWVTVP